MPAAARTGTITQVGRRDERSRLNARENGWQITNDITVSDIVTWALMLVVGLPGLAVAGRILWLNHHERKANRELARQERTRNKETKQLITNISDYREPVRYGFMRLAKAQPSDMSVDDLLKVFRRAARTRDRLTMFKLAVMTMPPGGVTWEEHHSNLLEGDSFWHIEHGTLTSTHIEAAATRLMGSRWALHPVTALESYSPAGSALAKRLFRKRVWKKHTTHVV